MENIPQSLGEIKSIDAVDAATAHAVAVEEARVAQINEAVLTSDTRIASIVSDSIVKFFNHGAKENRYIDVGRIPFICEEISGMHKSMETMAIDAKWTKWITVASLSFATIVGLPVVGWMLLQIIKNGTQIAILTHK